MPKVWNKRDSNTPKDAIYVGRPTRWGNPWKIGEAYTDECGLTCYHTRKSVVDYYRNFIENHPEYHILIQEHLRCKDLVCWCAPLPCHADVLLEIAND